MDQALGVVGVAPIVIAADGDDGWVVYAQSRDDTDGDGRIAATSGRHGEAWGGDVPRIWLDIRGEEQAIQGVVGASGGALIVVSDDTIVAIDLATREPRVLGSADAVEFPMTPSRTGRPATAAVSGGVVAWARSPVSVEVLDLASGTRSLVDAPEWLHAVDVGPGGVLIQVESLDQAPTDPADPWLLPHFEMSGTPHWCAGLGCAGPPRTTRIFRIDGPSVSLIGEARSADGRAIVLRSWGFVTMAPTAGFTAQDILGARVESHCALLYVGIDTPAVIGRCEPSGALMAWRFDGGSTPSPAELTLGGLDAIDRRLLERDDVRAALHQLDRVSAHAISPAPRGRTWEVPSLGLRWRADLGDWHSLGGPPCPREVIALRRDRWFLTWREAPRCEHDSEARGQLVWTGPLAPGLCADLPYVAPLPVWLP